VRSISRHSSVGLLKSRLLNTVYKPILGGSDAEGISSQQCWRMDFLDKKHAGGYVVRETWKVNKPKDNRNFKNVANVDHRWRGSTRKFLTYLTASWALRFAATSASAAERWARVLPMNQSSDGLRSSEWS
jgi:hypothetical protein